MELLRVEQVSKVYASGVRYQAALHPVVLTVQEAEFFAIVGPSGGGKSTLVSILGCLTRPDRGQYYVQGQLVHWKSSKQMSNLRGGILATIFQGFELIPHWTVLENVELGLRFRNLEKRVRGEIVLSVLRQLDMLRLAHKYPTELSGGEQQRVAIARAISVSPKVLLADEPTGNLDSDTASSIMELFMSLHAGGMTIVMVTHDTQLAMRAQRRLTIRKGHLQRGEPHVGASS